MPFSTYEDLHDDAWTLLIQKNYKREISQLKLMKFDETYYIRETGRPFSIFPMLAFLAVHYLFGSGEPLALLRVGGLLSAIAYQPYLVHIDGYAYGVAGYNRIKFATLFDDGTLLHTTNHQRSTTHHPEYRFIAQFCLTDTGTNGTFKDTWRMHIQRVERLAKTRAVISPLRVSDIIRMEMRADSILTGNAPEHWDDRSAKKEEE